VLIEVLRQVLDGNVSVARESAGSLRPVQWRRPDPPRQTRTRRCPDVSALTQRQLEVLARVCQGKTNKQIASELGLSEKTVKAHVTAIFKVLGVVNRTQAVLVARRMGLVTS